MDELQERVIRLVLAVLEPSGFALAGGQAALAHGLVSRPTQDVDIFTGSPDPSAFAESVAAAAAVLTSDGLDSEIIQQSRLFARLQVRDALGMATTLDLGVDYRVQKPVQLAVGQVLAREDVAGSKLLALYDRAYPRDALDVFGALAEGNFTEGQLLHLADERSVVPLDRNLLASAFRHVVRRPDSEFEEYGVVEETMRQLRGRLACWADDLAPG